ncbi:MAG: four helix bundle protein [Bacteroidota bacterium]
MSTFKNLWVWQAGINLAEDVYRITNKKPFSTDFGLKNQIQRAVVSISSNIAEGDERDSNKQSSHFFKIAKASNAEVITQLNIAYRIGYLDEIQLSDLEGKAMKIVRGCMVSSKLEVAMMI